MQDFLQETFIVIQKHQRSNINIIFRRRRNVFVELFVKKHEFFIIFVGILLTGGAGSKQFARNIFFAYLHIYFTSFHTFTK